MSGCAIAALFLQAGQTPQLSSKGDSVFKVDFAGSSNKPPASACSVPGFRRSQTRYWAKAIAIGRAPLPSLPQNNKAWLSRFWLTIAFNWCFKFSWPGISVNRIREDIEILDCCDDHQ